MKNKMKNMMNDIVRKFGLEDIHTIIFFGLCERNVSFALICETYDEYMALGTVWLGE